LLILGKNLLLDINFVSILYILFMQFRNIRAVVADDSGLNENEENHLFFVSRQQGRSDGGVYWYLYPQNQPK